jgi:hypothetical protein
MHKIRRTENFVRRAESVTHKMNESGIAFPSINKVTEAAVPPNGVWNQNNDQQYRGSRSSLSG